MCFYLCLDECVAEIESGGEASESSSVGLNSSVLSNTSATFHLSKAVKAKYIIHTLHASCFQYSVAIFLMSS